MIGMKPSEKLIMAILLVAACALIATQLEGNPSRKADDHSGIDPIVVLPGIGGGETYSNSIEPEQVEMVYPTTDASPKGDNGKEALYVGYAGKVLLMVQWTLYDSITSSLDIYRRDLEREGYTVEIYKYRGGAQLAFRNFLQIRKTGLTGAVLIGELPIPWMHVNPWCTGDTVRVPCDLPYMDMDGTWLDKDYDGDWDSALPSSRLKPDIWIGRLYAANLDSLQQASAINDYLYRNHQYRLNNTQRSSRALNFINFLDLSGNPWTCTNCQLITNTLATLYDTVVCVDSATGGNEKQGYLDSLASGYELVWILAHGGNPIRHWFEETNEPVDFNDILHAKSKALFVHNYSCNGALWTATNCVSNYYIFGNNNDTTSGLFAWGVTLPAPFHGEVDFYPALANRRNFGEAQKARADSVVTKYQRANICGSYLLRVCYDSTTGQYGDSCWYHPMEYVAFLGDPTLRPLKKFWHVNAAGTGDAPTIQAAIDSAMFYDAILLAPGTYTGAGNYNIDFKGKPVVITKEYDDSTVVINCQGNGRAFRFHSTETSGAKIIGLTIANGSMSGNGGAILCEAGSSPEIIDCLFKGNQATGKGGSIAVLDSCKPLIKGSTIVFASADSGAGLYVASNAIPVVKNCVIAYARSGGGVCYRGSDAGLVSCSNVFGNADSNYFGYPFSGVNGNITLNPQFCDTTNGNFKVDITSPNLPINNSCEIWLGSTRKGCAYPWPCGDANSSGTVNVLDPSYLTAYIYSGGPAPSPLSMGDVDCNSAVNISDAVYLIAYIFSGGPAPCALCQ
jgi:predicted outer membrane repeat protein